MPDTQKSPRYQVPRASLSVTSSLNEETNTNLIAHNNDRLPLRTSSLNEETNTNLIAHNNSGYSFCLMYKTFSIFSPVSRVNFQIVASFLGISLTQGISTRGITWNNHHIFWLLILKIEVTLLFQQFIIAELQHYSLPRGSGQSNNTKCSCQHRPSDLKIQRLLQ